MKALGAGAAVAGLGSRIWLAAHHLIFPIRGRSATAETTGNIGALLLVNKECKEVSVVTINRTRVLETVVVPL